MQHDHECLHLYPIGGCLSAVTIFSKYRVLPQRPVASVAGTNRGSSHKICAAAKKGVGTPHGGWTSAIRKSLLPSGTSDVRLWLCWLCWLRDHPGPSVPDLLSAPVTRSKLPRLLPISFSYSIKTRLAVAGAGTFLPVNVAPSASPLLRRSPKRGLGLLDMGFSSSKPAHPFRWDFVKGRW